MNQIERFNEQYSFLSNFFDAEVEFEGMRYANAEAAFQAAKCLDPNERKRFISIPPGAAKRLGRRITLRPDWETVKLSIMHRIVLDKFTRHPTLAEKLLATGDAKLIEGNYWHDVFWGVDLATGKGENHLGQILMQVRNEIRRKSQNK